MNPIQLLADCKQRIASHPAGSREPALVSLFLPGNGRGEQRKLAAMPGAPMGQIAAQYEDSDMVLFKAQEVAAFLEKALAAQP